jgi:hypothetical protein
VKWDVKRAEDSLRGMLLSLPMLSVPPVTSGLSFVTMSSCGSARGAGDGRLEPTADRGFTARR